MTADLFRVVARFENAEGHPFFGSEYEVLLLDKDRLFDDKLGARSISANGTAEFMFSVADIFSIDSPGERTPDIYFVITENGNEVWRSEVFSEVNFDAVDPVTGRKDSLTREFGPFRITA